MTELRVRKPDGWTTVSFPDAVATISVVGGKVDGQLCLSLTGEREDGARLVEPGILDVDENAEHLLENTVPRTEDGTSVVLDRLLPD
ncbi:hypothetical protein [Haloarcula marismortui]|uniref:Uncharacterized protein n=1 Tax=Haloarcula marismortui ATCC 33800 TaxID=662476 RepID=M0JRE3_9EURY|nr:hypothetical protein [Haloarcula sinaiiensis]EMA10245.1 hypothetical protein C436_18226 [Haloarcula sinaiiensis ATCC 33800]QUJ74993.1 hypothetical protein KDQ40_22355 [Haloarcula sinaiiensis ATCC 33800]